MKYEDLEDEEDKIIEDDYYIEVIKNRQQENRDNNKFKVHYLKFIKEHISMDKLLAHGYTKHKNKMICFILFLEYLVDNPIDDRKGNSGKSRDPNKPREQKITRPRIVGLSDEQKKQRNRDKALERYYKNKKYNEAKRVKAPENETPEEKKIRKDGYNQKYLDKIKKQNSEYEAYRPSYY